MGQHVGAVRGREDSGIGGIVDSGITGYPVLSSCR